MNSQEADIQRQLKALKQKLMTDRQRAIAGNGYCNLDSLYEVHEPLRQIYGPDIIRRLDAMQ